MFTVRLHITGMRCAGCVSAVEKALTKVKGVRSALVNLATGEARVERAEDAGATGELVQAVEQAGYQAQEIGQDDEEDGGSRELERTGQGRRWLIWAIGAAGAIVIMLLMLFSTEPWSLWAQFALATPIQFFIGWPFYRGAWKSLRRFRADMDTLVVLGTTVAYGYSVAMLLQGGHHGHLYFDTSAMILILIGLGKLLEERARASAMSAIVGLARLQPSEATVFRQNRQLTIPVNEVVPGDVVMVRPGQRVPVDGVVVEGESTLDASMVTGESEPIEVGPETQVIGGTMNQTGAFRMRALRTGKTTVLAQIVKLVREAQASKANVQRIVDKVAGVFVPVVIVIAVQAFVGWAWFTEDLSKGIRPMIAVLIVACPCALGLATPTAIMVGTGLGARHGILIKDAAAFERAGQLTHVILDKTGTLTRGRFAVSQIIALDPAMDETQILRLAAAVEAPSEHPVGKAIVDHAHQQSITLPTVGSFQSITAGGVRGIVERYHVIVGRVLTLREQQVRAPDDLPQRIDALRETSRSVVAVAVDGWTVGLIGLNDEIKPEATEVIQRLRRLKLKVVMMTGDSAAAAKHVAQQLGIEQTFAEVVPADKHQKVVDLKQQGAIVAMVGDGINDAPALAAADIGIAMGGHKSKIQSPKSKVEEQDLGPWTLDFGLDSAGTDIAAQAGHVVLIGGDLRGLPRAITLSRATMRRIYAGLFWAFIYNLILIPIAALGLLQPIYAAAAMSLSSVSVVLNALWLRKAWKP